MHSTFKHTQLVNQALPVAVDPTCTSFGSHLILTFLAELPQSCHRLDLSCLRLFANLLDNGWALTWWLQRFCCFESVLFHYPVFCRFTDIFTLSWKKFWCAWEFIFSSLLQTWAWCFHHHTLRLGWGFRDGMQWPLYARWSGFFSPNSSIFLFHQSQKHFASTAVEYQCGL